MLEKSHKNNCKILCTRIWSFNGVTITGMNKEKNVLELNKCKDISKEIKLYINSAKTNLEYKMWVDWKTDGTLRSVVKLDSNYYDFFIQ